MGKVIHLDMCTKRPGLFRSWDDSVEEVTLLTDMTDMDEYVQFSDGVCMSRSAFEGKRVVFGQAIDDGEIVELSV
jgi:hypothetical protein